MGGTQFNIITPHSGILFSHKKERNGDTCYNMVEPWKHAQ